MVEGPVGRAASTREAAEAWEALTTALGLKGLTAGKTCQAPADSPPFAGVVEYVTQAPYDGLMRIDTPGPGIAAIGTFDCGGSQSMVALHFYLYGEKAAETIAEETPRWEAWFAERFPAPAEAVKARAGVEGIALSW